MAHNRRHADAKAQATVVLMGLLFQKLCALWHPKCMRVAAVHIANHTIAQCFQQDANTLSVEMQVSANNITVAHLPCVQTEFDTPCVVNNLGNVPLGPVVRESDVPLAFFDPSSKVGKQCNASSTLGARQSCLARSVCVAYNAEANVMFDCYGPKCTGDILPASECNAAGQSRKNPALDQYLSFDVQDSKPLDTEPLVGIIQTPFPTPFVTAAPTPLTKQTFISSGRTNLDESEARVVCVKTCLDAPGGTAWAGIYRMPPATPQEPQPTMQCGCLVLKVTPPPTPFPSPFPTPVPTPAPTPDFTLRRLLRLPLVDSGHLVTGVSVPDFPRLIVLTRAVETNDGTVQQPPAMYMLCRAISAA